MPSRVVLFGATGHTGRLCAERLAARGERPLLAGRSEARLGALGARLGLDWAPADAARPQSLHALVEPGDVLVTTVGPFATWGDAAVRAAIAAPATYLDSTGEPAFIRRVMEELGPPAARAGATLMTAMGFDYVPGALAGALALRDAGDAAVRVDVGYFSLGARPGMLSRGTAASLAGAALEPMFAFRDGRLRRVPAAERVRSFRVEGRKRDAVSVGGAEHFTLPVAHARVREVNVYLGWSAGPARAVQAAGAAASAAALVPGLRAVLRAGGELVASRLPAPETAPEVVSHIVATAHDDAGAQVAEAVLRGADGYTFTAGFLAWAAARAARAGDLPAGAVGPLEAFGLEALERGCAEAGIARAPA